jgi:3-oxoacyl-[acyl-carrier-protein] synthase-3
LPIEGLLWLRTLDELEFDRSGVYSGNTPRYRHCCCADPFLSRTCPRREGHLVGGLYLLTSVGMRASLSR